MIVPSLPWFASIMYHRVVHKVAGPDPFSLQTTCTQFEQQLKFLKANGYRAVTPEQALAAALGREASLRRTVVLTFDDGYADFMTTALPILQRYQYSAVVMLVSGQIGGWNEWDEGIAERTPLMGKSEILEAQSAGITFASHSRTHRRLSRLTPGEVRTETRDSRRFLEDFLARPVPIFCYPYGDSSLEVRNAVIDAGYIGAFGNDQQEHEPFNLSRIDAARTSGVAVSWRLKVSGLQFGLGSRRRSIMRYLARLRF